MRIAPPALFGAAALSQLCVGRRPTALTTVVCAPLVLAAGWLGAGAVLEFARHGTTVDPRTLDRTSALVRTGPNAVTRNPMYLGLATLLTAHAVARRSPLALLPVAGFVAVVSGWQIPAEEAALTARFEEYADYVAQVPRWL
ncbi:methyltransferase family protein [Ornithinimicrobium avium]|uniref:Isoprenylcysteine carboxylmethyltransferase family protein n=1 Tax=Ornithinimicrobium avium TaxID=2283195 RepID=A0A345NMQ1_9MICO|nr:isoprenylcysteine carboxylmethyltransferase family protein [Ornithinimicrobium avium]AXH96309.1 isoprenylcysteine carboxylmethyltransferase family protein [Ornithinimicrobium avium]